ncbi:MAG TPA: prolyl oligopeptidase family serine peptidase [Gemmataceae bacterium]|jgi:dienelactone hydrolase|nr:prolyl oligopeptidase family serine peptidase [Gemmataceae bacterium]
MIRHRLAGWITLVTAIFIGGLSITRGEDPPKSREQQIAELEKQLADVQKKLADARASAATVTAKKPLTLAEADTWQAVRGIAISPDGKWFGHRVGPNEGDGEVVLRSADGKETRFPAGGGFGAPVFSHDSKWAAFGVTPFTKPGSPRPKSKITLVNLGTGEKTEIDGAGFFQFSGEAATHLAYRKSMETPVGPPAPGTPPAPAGSDLVLRELATGTDLVLGNVADFAFDKKGTWLVTVIDAAGQIGNGIHLRDMKTGATHLIEAGKATYRGLNWNEEFTAFALLKATDDPGSENKWNVVLGFTDLGPKPTRVVYDPKDDKDFPKDMAISQNRPVAWMEGLDALTFGIAERKKKEEAKKESGPTPSVPGKKDAPTSEKKDEKKEAPKPPDRPAATGPKPDLVVWHWKDPRLQPMQEKQAAADREFAFTAIYRVKEKKFLRLADDSVREVSLAAKHRYAIGRDIRAHEYRSYLTGKLLTDVYAIDIRTGEKKMAVTGLMSLFQSPPLVVPSPTGTHFLYFNDGNYHIYDMAAGKSTNVTASISATLFVDTEDDHNFAKPPTPPLGWSRDGKFVLLSDRWDIWSVAVDGSGGTNLTVNGKKDGIRYRGAVQFEVDPKPGIDLTQPIYALLYGEWTKKSGLGKIDVAKPGVNVLAWGDCQYGMPNKARNAEVFTFSRGTSLDYPDYYLTDGTFKDPKKVTTANPQQSGYLWSAGSKLIEYMGVDGKRLQGALFLPANYEAGKKYPTIVYIYEKLSQGLHQYSPPSTGGIGAIFTSNGYAVLMPDITYRLNDPGKSAAECILPALDAAIATGIVDGDKLALHGHSWGGYQTAFMVTQTNRFKCAIAGAALTDLVSMYSSVYWNAGMANQPIFESSQGRFTGPYWELQEAYIRNSPVYFAKNVQTPLLLLHNDKDGAVDFTQGVEYYNTLRRLEKPVVMLQYKGENHGLAKPENRRDYASRMKEFFDHHLMGKPAPEWWKEGVPYLKMDDHLKGRRP